MKLNAQDLKTIVNATLEHYNRRAEEFWAGTRDHDVSQNIAGCREFKCVGAMLPQDHPAHQPQYG
jgi:hypothetical protein